MKRELQTHRHPSALLCFFIIIFCLTACESAGTDGGGSADGEATTDEAAANDDVSTEGGYEAMEQLFERDGMKIYGELYIPYGQSPYPLVVGRPSRILSMCGANSDQDITVTKKVIDKAMRPEMRDENGRMIGNTGHGLTEELIVKAIKELESPVMIFRDRQEGSLIVVTSITDQKDRYIVIAIEFDRQEGFGLVQAEIERRKTIRSCRYSGKTVFSSRIVCPECGVFYGRKTLHSNTGHRKVIWRCSRKYRCEGGGDEKCPSRNVSEPEVMDALSERIRALISENARNAGNQDAYAAEYGRLVDAYREKERLVENLNARPLRSFPGGHSH